MPLQASLPYERLQDASACRIRQVYNHNHAFRIVANVPVCFGGQRARLFWEGITLALRGVYRKIAQHDQQFSTTRRGLASSW